MRQGNFDMTRVPMPVEPQTPGVGPMSVTLHRSPVGGVPNPDGGLVQVPLPWYASEESTYRSQSTTLPAARAGRTTLIRFTP